MTHERTVLLVVHTGRDEATETARRVQKVLSDNGIDLRVLSAEAVDRGSLHLSPDDMRALGVDIEVVDPEGRINDFERVEYLQGHFDAAWRAMGDVRVAPHQYAKDMPERNLPRQPAFDQHLVTRAKDSRLL